MNTTRTLFAERINAIPESFIREILKVATTPDVISFAGGLPNPSFFPKEKLAIAAEKVIRHEGSTVLQYAPTEGYLPLRDHLAQQYAKKSGLKVTADQLIILNGSQQGLDLVGKLFCEKGRSILLEEPSYLGAIQAFSAYQPSFNTVPLRADGPDPIEFNNITRRSRPFFFYCIPNFQNPTGAVYSTNNRLRLVESQFHSGMMWIEDNPYGEIRFDQEGCPDIYSLIPDTSIHLGSFSKIVSPGLRLGWAIGPADIIKKMTIAKQASDLHSNNLAQRIVYQFLCDNCLEDHLTGIRTFYAEQAKYMSSLIRRHFPPEIHFIEPKGGMFLWLILPDAVDATKFLNECMKEKVLFVPGSHFFLDPNRGKNTIRLNFSNPSRLEMERGIEIMARVLQRIMCC